MGGFRLPRATASPDEIRAAERHFRLAQEAGGIGTWEWRLDTGLPLWSGDMLWSAQMFRNLGLSPEPEADRAASVSAERLLASVHPEDRARVAALLDESAGRAGKMRIECRIVCPDGAVRWIVLLGEAMPGEDGKPAVMRGISIDSTRRREIVEATETALHDRERRLRELNEELAQLADRRTRQLDASRAQIQAIYDNSPDWLSLFRATADGRFIYEDLNTATERGYGLTRDQVIGRPVEEILGVEQAQVPISLFRACIRTGENQRYTARRTMSGVTRTIDVMFARVPEKHDGDWLIMATARDITEREEIEQQLRQAQKMEAVGQLTGGVAHDFNNLLTAIIGNLELLAPRIAGDPDAVRFARAATRAAENGARLTEQLLAFSRRQHLQPRAVDLNAVVAGMREMLTRTIGAGIEVRLDLSADLWPALIDPTQIETAILNLAINARDAMPSGGALTIETRNLPKGISVGGIGAGSIGAEGSGAHRELAGRDCVGLSVRDTGTGMSEEVLRSAVEPFFTTKEPGKGSGLGLSQVYGTVQQSNGAMQIESRIGAGTAVHLLLPRALVDAEAAEPAREPAAAAMQGGRVLVVDDDPGVREITAQMLRQCGFTVTEAASGQAALDALGAVEVIGEGRGEPCELVVIDIAMPGLSGVETIAWARSKWPGLRVLYMTGYADAAGANPDTGGDKLLKKPFHLPELQYAVRDALDRRPRSKAKDGEAPEADSPKADSPGADSPEADSPEADSPEADTARSAAMQRASPRDRAARDQTARDQTARDQTARDQTAIGG
jgi:PAS domain S-box-containing protein